MKQRNHWMPTQETVQSLDSHLVRASMLLLQSCPTLRDPVDCSMPCSLVHGILQARIPE